CSKLFLEALYENHPYGRLLYGSEETVNGFDSEQLKAYHRAWIRPERLVVSVSGNISSEQLEHWLSDLERRFSQKDSAPYAEVGVTPEHALKAPRWVERKLGREQIHIIAGGLGITYDSPERFAERLL